MSDAKTKKLMNAVNIALQNAKSSVSALELALEELQNNAVPKKSRTEENIEKFRLSKKYK
jgi:hypothetical protein